MEVGDAHLVKSAFHGWGSRSTVEPLQVSSAIKLLVCLPAVQRVSHAAG